MAVAHSAASESHSGTTGSVSQTSFSWTHTQTGTPQGVLVFVHVANNTGNPVSSVTYGGVTLTRVNGGAAVDSAGEAGRTDLFFAGSGLGTGNQTITVNRANTTAIMYASAATVTAATATNVTGIVLLQGDGALTVQSVTDGGAPTDSLRYAAAYSGLAAPPPAGTGSTLLNSIDFGNYGIALVRETTAGTGARNVGFNNATTDDRAAVHVAVRELWNRSLPQTVASFTLTGNDATFTKASPKVITAETGAFSLTGNPADLRHNPDLEAGTGAFALNGNPADTRHNVRIEGGTGAFTLAGQPATLAKAAVAKVLTAEAGTFAFTGNPATTRVAAQLAGDLGKFFLPERNQRQWSEEFDNAYWTKTNSSVTANATTAPDGTLTADVLIENTTPSTGHQITRNVTYVTGKTYTHSCYFKLYPGPITRYARLQLGSTTVFGTDVYANINLATGTVINTPGLGATASVTNAGNGWYRASITLQYTGAGVTVGPGIQIISTAGSALYTDADGLSGIYVWGAQWEESAAVTDYDPTGASSATDAALRQAYKLTADVSKFFLPERNLLKWSEEFQNTAWTKVRCSIVANATLSPDGLLLGDKVVEDTSNNTHILQLQNSSPVLNAGLTYAFSWYLKAGERTLLNVAFGADNGVFGEQAFTVDLSNGNIFNVSVTGFVSAPTSALVGDGWYRVTATVVAGASALPVVRGRPVVSGSTTYQGDGSSGYFIWGAQLEQSAAVTDYDPTGPAGATDTALRQNYAITAEVGAFTVAGQPATLRHNPRIEANTGSFALSGGAPALLRGRYLSGGAGTFTETGQPATFRRTWAVQATTGTFALTGNPAALTELGAYEIDPIAGSFTLSGQPANLAQSQTMPITVGTFTLTGQPATLRHSPALAADRGQFTFTGQPAALKQGYRLDGGTGSFALTGNPAILADTDRIEVTTGIFALSGNPALLKRGLSLAGSTGAFAFTGNPTTLVKLSAKQLAAAAGVFNLTGQPLELRINTALIGDRGQFTLGGQLAQLIQSKKLYTSAGTFSLLGNDATLQKVIPLKEIQVQSGSFALSGQTAILAVNLSVFASAGVVAFSGKPATFNYQQRRRVIIIF